jgi:hypothetical protein
MKVKPQDLTLSSPLLGPFPVHIDFLDTDLREIAKTAKGRWDPEQKLWRIKYGKIKGTALEKHIILDAFQRNRKA